MSVNIYIHLVVVRLIVVVGENILAQFFQILKNFGAATVVSVARRVFLVLVTLVAWPSLRLIDISLLVLLSFLDFRLDNLLPKSKKKTN